MKIYASLIALTLCCAQFGFFPTSATASVGDVKAEGTIEALSATEITVNTVVFVLNEGTEWEGLNDEKLGDTDFSIGEYVEVSGLIIDGILVAREVEKDSPDSSDDSSYDDDDDDDSSDDDDDSSDDDDDSSNDDDSSSDDDDDSSDDDSSSSDNSSNKGKDKSKKEGSKANSGVEKVKVSEKSRLNNMTFRIKRKSNKNKKGRGRDRIDVRLKVDLPSTLPALPDEASAAAADIRIAFAREGIPYATCSLVFSEIDDSKSDDSASAKYRLRLKKRYRPSGDKLSNKDGLCDVDDTASGDQEGTPDVQKGDTYSVYEVTQTADNEFIAGEL